MVSMATLEMNGLFSVIDRISASFTVPICSKTVEFLVVIILQLFSESLLNKIGGNVHDVDHMWEIFKDVDKSFGHFATHVEIVVFGL